MKNRNKYIFLGIILLSSLIILPKITEGMSRKKKKCRSKCKDKDKDYEYSDGVCECIEKKKSSGGSCLGSKTIIMTEQGKKELNELRIGDRILISNGLYSTVCYIRHHDKDKSCDHYRITFSDNQTIYITGEHLLYNHNDELVCAKTLKVGNTLAGSNSIITQIEIVKDIPLTPVVIEGYMMIAGKKISCWSGNVKNANNLNKLMEYVKKAFENGMSVEYVSNQIHEIYEMYSKNGKNLNKIEPIAQAASKKIMV